MFNEFEFKYIAEKSQSASRKNLKNDRNNLKSQIQDFIFNSWSKKIQLLLVNLIQAN